MEAREREITMVKKDFLGDVAARDDVAREVTWTVHLVKTTYK